MAEKQKEVQFTYAIKTLEHFKEIGEHSRKNPFGEYLQLWTAKPIENKKNITIPIALYAHTGQKRKSAQPEDTQTKDARTPGLQASVLNDTLPKLYEFWQECSNSNPRIPLFIIGHSFDEVFERKIRLLAPCIPDIRMLQYINVHRFINSKNSIEKRRSKVKKDYDNLSARKGKIKDERTDFMSAMHDYLSNGGELGGKKYDILDWEVQTGQGTKRAEKIDFLAVEKSKKWLTVIELKFARSTDTRLKAAIFQGIDYANWVEKHKYELAMIYPKPKIHLRHRTRLILINGPKGFPGYYRNISGSYCSKDKYQEIEFYALKNEFLPISPVKLFEKEAEIREQS